MVLTEGDALEALAKISGAEARSVQIRLEGRVRHAELRGVAHGLAGGPLATAATERLVAHLHLEALLGARILGAAVQQWRREPPSGRPRRWRRRRVGSVPPWRHVGVLVLALGVRGLEP